MYIYNVSAQGAIAHKLEHYDGLCSNLHGHSIEVEATFSVQTVNEVTNMSVDFKFLKELLKKTVPDHRYLNEMYNCTDPTAEFLAKVIFEQLENELDDYLGIIVESVTVWESDRAGVTYEE